jgi:hypothetical protein
MVKMPSLAPPGDQTQYSHPKCYMAATNNCSKTISREHYISAAILKQFPTFKVSGLPFLPDGEMKELPINALASNILCTRHNTALSPIDDLASHAFRCFVEAPLFATSRRSPGRPAYYLASGAALEIWMVKTLAGVFHARIAAAGRQPLKDFRRLPEQTIINALSTGVLPTNSGLFFGRNEREIPQKAISIMPLSDRSTGDCVGIRTNFGTVQFDTLLVPLAREMTNERTLRRRRPGVIDFNGPYRDARIVLSWDGQGSTVQQFGIELRAG